MVSNSREHSRRPVLATLVRTVPVRVRDVSRCGCRLESTRWLSAGLSGRLQLSLDGRVLHDDVRIARCQRLHGAGQSFMLGAELLRTRRLSSRSIRLAIGQLIGDQEATEHPPPTHSVLRVPDGEAEQLAKGVSRAPPRYADDER